MEMLLGHSGRSYTALPIDASRGFPQSFPVLFGGRTYQFQLYVNVPASLIQRAAGIYALRTILSSALDDAATSIVVASTDGFPVSTPFGVRVDNELLNVTGIAGTSWCVIRGVGGTKAAAHTKGAFLSYTTPILDLPSSAAHLVMKVETALPDGTLETAFLRKIISGFEYEVENIALQFKQQRVAVSNLNGQGDFGSLVAGGIASRWA
jgi:hypothetical protein